MAQNQKDLIYLKRAKKRLIDSEITSVYQLENYNIYYYNKNIDKPKYRKAELVMFGLSQYHKSPPPKEIINEIVDILKSASSVDICYDMHSKPDYEALSPIYKLRPFVTDKGVVTTTRYINQTYEPLIEHICIYDKQNKNELDFAVWRIEAKILIYDTKEIYLPLREFKSIVDLASSKE